MNDMHNKTPEIVNYPIYISDDFVIQDTSDYFEPTDINLYDENYYKASLSERTLNWIKEHKLKLGLGITATSLAVTLTTNPLSEFYNDVTDAAPWVGGGIAISEVAFCTGAAMMIGAVGGKIGNPLKFKERIPEIAQKANDSKMFKAGFWINAIGAVGDFVAISIGVLKEMPVSTYPLLSLTLLDLGATVMIRKAVLEGIEKNTNLDLEDNYGNVN